MLVTACRTVTRFYRDGVETPAKRSGDCCKASNATKPVDAFDLQLLSKQYRRAHTRSVLDSHSTAAQYIGEFCRQSMPILTCEVLPTIEAILPASIGTALRETTAALESACK